MSLFNNISQSLHARQALGRDANSVLGELSGGIQGALGGGSFGAAIGAIASNQASTAIGGFADRAIGPKTLGIIDTGANILNDVAGGNFDSAGLRLLDSGLLTQFIPGIGNIVAQARYLNTATPVFGGISPNKAKQMIEEMQGLDYAKKNLFLLEVSSPLTGGVVDNAFNLFCTEASYSAQTITGEKRRVGGAHIDAVNSSDPVEMRLTTLDDKAGSIKRWFSSHSAATVHRDGTVGVPADYFIKIKIVHAFITQETNYNGYEDVGLYRAGSIETNLSRREDGLEEITMSFVQLDTYKAP